MRLRGLATVMLAAGLALGGPARAQFTVFDPTNYAQNLLQAARALDQLQAQLQGLQNEARNLAPLGLKAAGALDGDLARTNALLAEAGRLARDVDGLRAQYDREYRPAGGSGAALTAAADARWSNSLDALRRTLAVQTQVTGGLAATTAVRGHMVPESWD